MRRLLGHLPSPVMVVGLIALFVALGGVSYAAATPSSSPGSAYAAKKTKKPAAPLTKAQIIALIKKFVLSGPKGSQGAGGAQGAQGLQGAQGAQGPQGAGWPLDRPGRRRPFRHLPQPGCREAQRHERASVTVVRPGARGDGRERGDMAGVANSVFGRTGAVTAQAGDYTAAQVTNAADTSSASTQAFTGNLSAPALVVGGLSGAVAASRHVGATASGAPTSGTFAVGTS